MAGGARVFRNDWGALVPPPVGGWQPRLSISVIIPAYNCQQCLDIALAALAHQTYPSELLEVVVVDDGSEPPLDLPADAVPGNCRLVRAPEHSTGWGRANALAVGAAVSGGALLHWLDADLVPFPEHVEAQARWHELAPDAVTLGYKRFVPASLLGDLARLREQVVRGEVAGLFPTDATEPHQYVEELIDTTDRLCGADHLVFRSHVGATAALRRELYRAAGGLDTRLRLGEDTEFGYRLAQAGAVFIPEPGARSWHLGPSHSMTVGERQRRYNQPFLADRMPLPRWLRDGARRRSWAVPLVTAVVAAGGSPLDLVRACVDRLLASDEYDLQVWLVGEWGALPDRRRAVLDDPLQDQRLIAATYRSEPRVRLVERAPATAFPSPYLLRVPVYLGVAPDTVRRLISEADACQAGLLRLLPPGAEPVTTATPPPTIELWRTAAVSRARRVARLPESTEYGERLAELVASVWGAGWGSGVEFDVVSLPAALAAAAAVSDPAPTHPAGSPRPIPTPVPVAGLRSLVRATGYVGRLAATRAWRQLAPRRARVS